MDPAEETNEQSEAERLAIARRYRKQRRSELRELVQPLLPRGVSEVGEFSTAPVEALAAVPVVGALFAFAVRAGGFRRRLSPTVLLALDAEQVHLLSQRERVSGPEAELVSSWPREEVRVLSVQPSFMRERVELETPEEKPLKLYASSLRTNPWAAGVVRELGGEAPEPMDLGEPESDPGGP